MRFVEFARARIRAGQVKQKMNKKLLAHYEVHGLTTVTRKRPRIGNPTKHIMSLFYCAIFMNCLTMEII